MGNYRQHLTFAGVLGVVYAGLALLVGGVHWVYGSVAALLTTLSGLLPDLDSQTGVEMKTFTGVLGVLSAAAVWRVMATLEPPPAFEVHLWAMVVAYLGVRHGVRKVAGKIAVHRGMSHSIPTCGVWGVLAYLYYPADDHNLRLVMATAVVLGFMSHLLLDEMFSVDLQGARVNKAFGTALKFWAPSPWSTLTMYGLLSWLTWQAVQVWPEGPFQYHAPPPPVIPYAKRAQQLKELAEQVAHDPRLKPAVDAVKAYEPAARKAVESVSPEVDRLREAGRAVAAGDPQAVRSAAADLLRASEGKGEVPPPPPPAAPTKRSAPPSGTRPTTRPRTEAPATRPRSGTLPNAGSGAPAERAPQGGTFRRLRR